MEDLLGSQHALKRAGSSKALYVEGIEWGRSFVELYAGHRLLGASMSSHLDPSSPTAARLNACLGSFWGLLFDQRLKWSRILQVIGQTSSNFVLLYETSSRTVRLVKLPRNLT